jgi:general secretion pathway protein G
MDKQQERGFSLLEIMVVLMIIGILAAMVAPTFIEQADEAKVESTRVQMKTIGSALKLYRLQNGKYPTSGEGLNALVQGVNGKTYLETMPKDAWGNPFIYLAPGVHGDYDILSHGADGKAGGSGFDADIGNWE